ncbi:hypothetical protein CM1200mP19_1840 [bacterium]|nr:MAG: hypothetical protein CM1200mP19_1840 [bacterium]
MSLGVCLVLVATLTVASGLLVVVETGILHIRRSRAEVLVERLVDRRTSMAIQGELVCCRRCWRTASAP